MTEDQGSVLDRALAAAASQILSAPLALPSGPPVADLCKTVGIGASTFYRLYRDADEFHHALTFAHIHGAVLPSRSVIEDWADNDNLAFGAIVEDITSTRREAVPAENNSSTPEAECAAIIGAVSRSYYENSGEDDRIEAVYLPWAESKAVATAISQTFAIENMGWANLAPAYLRWTGRRPIESISSDDIIRRIAMITVASQLVNNSEMWITAANEIAGTGTYCHVSTVDAITEPDE